MEVRWARVARPYGRYWVSDQGQVRGARGAVLRPQPRGDYLRVRLYNGTGVSRYFGVHNLVADAFLPKAQPNQIDVAHRNGRPWDNRASNLRRDTRKGNVADQVDHGTRRRGEDVYSAKLTPEQIPLIVAEYAAGGTSHRKLAQKYGVSHMAIGAVLRGKCWGWTKEEVA